LALRKLTLAQPELRKWQGRQGRAFECLDFSWAQYELLIESSLMALKLHWLEIRGIAVHGGSLRPVLCADNQTCLQGDRGAEIEVVRRGGHHGAVDFLELLRRPAALDVNSVAEVVVTRFDRRVNPQETAQVDIPFRLNAQLLELDAFMSAPGAVADDHAG